mmetsp:Transcript_21072/g.60123  ORF Transcript_21072/g.60123 Transcript_21072/m.60123 type:complete len:241 (-) Transcript_21072:344-1066(-)
MEGPTLTSCCQRRIHDDMDADQNRGQYFLSEYHEVPPTDTANVLLLMVSWRGEAAARVLWTSSPCQHRNQPKHCRFGLACQNEESRDVFYVSSQDLAIPFLSSFPYSHRRCRPHCGRGRQQHHRPTDLFVVSSCSWPILISSSFQSAWQYDRIGAGINEALPRRTSYYREHRFPHLRNICSQGLVLGTPSPAPDHDGGSIIIEYTNMPEEATDNRDHDKKSPSPKNENDHDDNQRAVPPK